MTAKDLHFSFDSRLAPDEQTAAKKPGAKRPPRRAAGHAGAAPISARARRPAPRAPRQWPAVAAVALVNMAFIALAGLWLTGNYYPPGAGDSPDNRGVARLESAIAALQGAADTAEQRLAALQSKADRQERVLAALHTELAGLRALQIDSPAPEQDATTETRPAVSNWHVNLGNFPTMAGAVALQQQLAQQGHTVKISPQTGEGEETYTVMLDGFSDRNSADLAARALMEQTSLNGLWVWKEN